MYKPNFQKREVIVFRQFQRKGYSLFACLGREVLISVLSVATLSATKAAGISDETWRADADHATTVQARHNAPGKQTAGNGTTYSFATLAQLPEFGVTYVDGAPGYYLVERNDTIAESDRFVLDENVIVKFEDQVTLVIKGEADFTVSDGSRTTFTRAHELATPYSIKVNNTQGARFRNVTFDYVGVESMSTGAIEVENCTFTNHTGTSAAALYFITNGQESLIRDCLFETCKRAAIGSAANASQPMTISRCQLKRNSTDNRNIPQINITASKVTIDGCIVEGDSTSQTINNMVGGIGISNFSAFPDTEVLVKDCQITHNRYGIGTVGPVNIRIEQNHIRDNNHEANPMNGGSGISLYDPYAMTTAVIAGNHIEGNIWGITIIGCKDVNVGQPTASDVKSPGGNTFLNNGFDGQPYDLYNNSKLTVYAQNNKWSVSSQTEEQIESVIFHKNDDSSLGEVIFMPAYDNEAAITLPRLPVPAACGRYGLNGMRLPSSTTRQLFIENGKKYFR
ncbi:MAG: hypothetical protein IJ081_05995 [Prevotella sp.]|nr:hypothetical protein [Prevotella sp.]